MTIFYRIPTDQSPPLVLPFSWPLPMAVNPQQKLTNVPRNILLVSADKTVEIVDVDVSSHRRIHARCFMFISCSVTPLEGTEFRAYSKG